MTAKQIANMLRAHRHGGYWTAKCPAHGDKHPSLSIKQDKDGKVHLRCFTGCSVESILSVLGLSFGDLYLDADRESWLQKKREAERRCPSIKTPASMPPLGPLEAVYRYTDSHGELVAEKLRHAGKVFLWRRPQAGGGWLWKVDRADLPLYRLHEVLKAAVVVLVEGEKDADNVAKLGICATTAPNGAKSWKPEYAPLFAGKKVWIIPDSDKPGMAYAGMAGKQISEHARFVRIVSVYPAKDVSDYLLTHTPAELSALMKAKPLLRYPSCQVTNH